MRIIKGRDYYDGGLAYGYDESIVFVRKEEDLRPHDFLPVPSWGSVQPIHTMPLGGLCRGCRRKAYHVSVYFCGRLYVGFTTDWLSPHAPATLNPKVAWDLEQLVDLYRDGDVPLNDKEIQAAKRYFDHYNDTTRAMDQLVEKGITIATMYPRMDPETFGSKAYVWGVDGADLGTLQFFKVKDTFTAFQEISMWIGGVLPKPGPEMATIKDENIRIEKRGFDSKTSFRKESTKKRGKRIKT